MTTRTSPPSTGAPLRRALLLTVLLLAPTVAACGAHGPPEGMASTDLYDWARERFEEGDYGSARLGFDDFLLREPLHPRTDSAQYLLGESNFLSERYLEAAEAFERLAINRPGSDLADDAQFGVCRSYWELSPDLALDQEYTRQAQDACERLLQYYSPSPLEEEARELRRKTRSKLAAKKYRVGKWYFDREAYESANIYLEEVLQEYPEAPVVPDVLVTLFRSYREMGFDREARDVRQRLLDDYGDSPQAREIRGTELPGAT